MTSSKLLTRAKNDMGKLFVVATPIGNLEDVSPRAIRVLKEAAAIICEDTRVSQKLLSHFEIHRPLISYHHHSRLDRLDAIVERLRAGDTLALVSDAGTPGISDPGNVLIRYVVERLPGIAIVAVPGPSALAAAASLSGLPTDNFLFLGFLPHKKGRVSLIKRISESEMTVIFYESPHRILKTLDQLKEILKPDRQTVIIRETTKVHEERIGETIEACWKYFQEHPDKVRGEFVVVVSGRGKDNNITEKL
ncbi:MAG: 16S rRNA (cytidine(1402)-2'-O)-methyltransferase [Patescibacteria group bacterium]|nr:16S rRNA (cytidine(1402)-2'-O)-methyltransferase [Patescibacteria group bacterium]